MKNSKTKTGKIYFYINDTGTILPQSWTDSQTDNLRLSIGNAFTSHQDAIDAVALLKEIMVFSTTGKFSHYNISMSQLTEFLKGASGE